MFYHGLLRPRRRIWPLSEGVDRTLSRGPDDSRIVDVGGGILAFHRLAIMGLSPAGMQPLSWTAAMRCATGSCTA